MRIDKIGDAILYCADNNDVFATIQNVDITITDPPYSEEVHSRHARIHDLRRDYLSGMAYGASEMENRSLQGIDQARAWEAIAFLHRAGKTVWNGRGKHAVYDIPKIEGEHPTQKPIKLVEQFVLDFSNLGELIFDPFMGYGTTGVAELKLGRRFIGIEKDPHYFEVECRCIEEA